MNGGRISRRRRPLVAGLAAAAQHLLSPRDTRLAGRGNATIHSGPRYDNAPGGGRWPLGEDLAACHRASLDADWCEQRPHNDAAHTRRHRIVGSDLG
jgi:hypothetical protein